MTQRIVLCARSPETPVDASLYLEVVCRLEEQVAELGGRLVAWSADRFSFCFESDRKTQAMDAAALILGQAGSHALGIAQRELLSQSGTSGERAFGLALVLAEALASAAPAGAILFDPDLRADELSGLEAVDVTKVRFGDVVLSATLAKLSRARTSSPIDEERASTVPRLSVPRASAPAKPPQKRQSAPELAGESRPSSPGLGELPVLPPRPNVVAKPVAGQHSGPPPPPVRTSVNPLASRSGPPQHPPPRRSMPSQPLLEQAPSQRPKPPPKPSVNPGAAARQRPSRAGAPPPKPKSIPPPKRDEAPDSEAEPEPALEARRRSERPSVVEALRSGNPDSMLKLAGQLRNEAGQEALVQRLEAMAQLASGEVGRGLGALREAATSAKLRDAKNQGRAALALAVGLAMTGKKQEALLQGLEALARALRREDHKGEVACKSFISQLARSSGYPGVADGWLPGVSQD